MRTSSGCDTDPLVSGNEAIGLLQRDAKTLHLAFRGPLTSRHYIYISTGETGLYEKYGYSFWKMMKDVNGEDSRVYRKEIRDIFCCRVMNIDDYEKVYDLWMSCKNMGFNNLDDSREGIEKYLKRNPTTCFVVVKDEDVIGEILSGHDGRRGVSITWLFRRNTDAMGLLQTFWNMPWLH